MKDITIKAETFKKELTILLGCFILAFLVNFYAIITREGAFVELFSQIGIVVVISLAFYAVAAIIRSIVYGIRMWIAQSQTPKTEDG